MRMRYVIAIRYTVGGLRRKVEERLMEVRTLR